MSVAGVTLAGGEAATQEGEPMTTITATVRPASGPPAGRQRTHLGAWRAAVALPAAVGSLLLLLVLLGGLGPWEGPVLLAWLAGGAATLTRPGERAAVRLCCGFRRPTSAQADALRPVWTAAISRAGIPAGDVDLYVKRAVEPNGYTVGRRSLAVSSGLLELFLARRLGDDQIVAVLVHELGHHATGATRYTPASSWLAAPWRIASRLVIGIPLAILGRRQPKPLLALVLTVAVVRGVQQLIAQHQWAPALLLATTAAGAVVCPLADAALSRGSEYAADRYAADRGAGSQLAVALRAVERRPERRGWAGRALATHPGTDRRVEALSRQRQAAGRR